jgi:universal stress protein A
MAGNSSSIKCASINVRKTQQPTQLVMKVKPGRSPGRVTVELNRRDEPLIERGLEEARGTGWPFQLKNILVPTDFSDFSQRALEYAVPLAKKFGAKITLFHAVEPAYYPGNEVMPIELEEMTESMTSEGKRMLEQIREEDIPSDIDSKELVTLGRAYNEIILAASSEHADIIVIATHGYTGLKHILMGSTAERVVRHATCPVLVVRERKHESATKS